MKKIMLEYAESYLSKGFTIFPVKPKQKRPAVKWKVFQFRKPTHDELKRWFGHKNSYGIAIVTGQISGICVMDFDSPEAYQKAKIKGLPKTPTVKTAKGYHAYFKYPDNTSNFHNRVDISGFDIRGDGGYVVAPPSIHPSGHRYKWAEGMGLDDLPLARLPEWIMREVKTPVNLSQHKNKQSRKLMKGRPLNELLQGVDEGCRNHSMTRIAGVLVSRGCSHANSLGILLKINQRNRPPLPPREVGIILKSIMRKDQHRTESLIEQKLRELQPAWEKAKPIFFDTSLHKN